MYKVSGKNKTKFIEVQTGVTFNTNYGITELLPDAEKDLISVKIPDFNKTFGEYFLKCCGELNSVRKIAKPDGISFVHTPVCKKYIGYIPSGSTNAAYMDDPCMILVNLSKAHVGLISKRSKRETVADFVDWKLELNKRIQMAQQKVMGVIPEVISWTKVVNILTKDSSRAFGNITTVGISKQDTIIAKKDEQFTIKTISQPSWMGDPEFGNRAKSVHSEHLDVFRFTIEYNGDTILTVDIHRRYNYKLTMNIHNHGNDISHIDFAKMLKIASDEVNDTIRWIETSLEVLREKHLMNFVLNSMGEDNCAI